MAKIAKITVTLTLDEDPEWLLELLRENFGDEADDTDNDMIHDAISAAIEDDGSEFFKEFDDFRPLDILVFDE